MWLEVVEIIPADIPEEEIEGKDHLVQPSTFHIKFGRGAPSSSWGLYEYKVFPPVATVNKAMKQRKPIQGIQPETRAFFILLKLGLDFLVAVMAHI